MKKTLVIILIAGATSFTYAGFLDDVSNAVDKTTKTVNSVNSSVKHANVREVSITDLINNPSKYADSGVKVSGTIVSLIKNGDANYTVVLTDGSKKVNCNMSKRPELKLEDNAEFTGIFNGKDTIQVRRASQMLD